MYSRQRGSCFPELRDDLRAHADNLGAALDQVRQHLAHTAVGHCAKVTASEHKEFIGTS